MADQFADLLAEKPQHIHCPACKAEFSVEPAAILPDFTDMTLSLHVEKGQMMMLETLGGVLTSFAELQKAVGESLDIETGVFVKGLQITDGNEVLITTRICNVVKGKVATQSDLFSASGMSASGQDREAGLEAKPASPAPEGGDAQPQSKDKP